MFVMSKKVIYFEAEFECKLECKLNKPIKLKKLRRKIMKHVFLGLLMVAAMSISFGVNAEDNKTKKETPKAETTTVKTTKAETTKSEVSCCSAAPAATCCSTAAKTTSCCSAQSDDAKIDEKKDCGLIEKTISDKKTEAKKKK